MDRPGTAPEKVAALSYFILKLAEWEIERTGEPMAIFNATNNFSLNKILLLPFYLCTANGEDTRTELFTFYNRFFAEDIGSVERDVRDNLHLIGLTFRQNETGIQIGETYLDNGTINLTAFKNQNPIEAVPEISNVSGEIFPIANVYDLVDHSVSVYKANNWYLAEFDDEMLTTLCFKHSAWQVYRILSSLAGQPIDRNMLIKERSVFSKNIENRMLA